MNLAFCLFNYFPYGGLQRDFLRIITLCHQRGHNVHVYTMEWQGKKPSWLPLTLLKKRGLTNHARAYHFVKQLQKTLLQTSYDCVIGFNKMPNLDIYFAADGCFVAQDKYQKSFLMPFHPRYRTYAALEQAVFSLESTTEILYIAEQEKIKYQNYYQTPESRWHFLPPGIDKNCIRPKHAMDIRQKYRQTLSIPTDYFVLLFIASRFETKGLDRVIAALSHLPLAIKEKTLLLVAGDDRPEPYRKILRQQSIHNHVVFLGARNDIAELLLTADALIHPARWENTGTVIIEAIAAGLPVLTTACCGYAHYVHDAQAGKVIPSPFKQTEMNVLLRDMLDVNLLKQYQDHAIAFTHHADLFSLPEKAVDFIEHISPT